MFVNPVAIFRVALQTAKAVLGNELFVRSRYLVPFGAISEPSGDERCGHEFRYAEGRVAALDPPYLYSRHGFLRTRP